MNKISLSGACPYHPPLVIEIAIVGNDNHVSISVSTKDCHFNGIKVHNTIVLNIGIHSQF